MHERNAVMHVCGYCRAEFDTPEQLTAHDDSIHGRRGRLEDERNMWMNQFGRGRVYDGRVRQMIENIDRQLSES